jgi:urease accessory protein
MTRVIAIKPAGQWHPGDCFDQVTLDADERHCRRTVLTGMHGLTFLLDLPHATVLHDGDGLMLDDGRVVCVVSRPEPLVEIAAGTAHDLARFAWHLGNRHTAVQVVGDRLRIRRDHVLEEMLTKLGAQLNAIEAPFEPEGGAYGHHAHGNGGHQHGHDHDD